MQKSNAKKNYHGEHREIIVLKKEKNAENTEKKVKKEIATDEHGNTRIKKIFCCFNKNRMWGGMDIRVYQCKSVANSNKKGNSHG